MPRPTASPFDDSPHRDGSGPAQDPSALTTQQILREQFWSREVTAAELASIRAEMGAAAEAVKLLQDFANRTPTTSDVNHKVDQLREVLMARLDGVKDTFTQNAVALTQAFQAQEKQAIATNTSTAAATQKMEEFFIKQFDTLNAARKDDSKVADDKLGALGNRVTIIESRTSVSDPSTQIRLAQLGTEVAQLGSGADVSRGRSAGMLSLWALIISAIGTVSSIIIGVSIILKYATKG